MEEDAELNEEASLKGNNAPAGGGSSRGSFRGGSWRGGRGLYSRSQIQKELSDIVRKEVGGFKETLNIEMKETKTRRGRANSAVDSEEE